MSVLLSGLILAHYFFLLELIIEQSKHTCTNVKFLNIKDRYTNYTSVALSGLAEVEKAINPIELSVDWPKAYAF